MRQISLNRIIINNFRSFKEECVNFPPTIGLKLLSGVNESEKRLGANGAGKTSLWRAFQWCLYGDQRVNQVLSWDEKLVEVLTELLINGVSHSIYRCGPPMKVELNGKLTTQQEINELIGLTEDRFRHSVIFGQGQPLFPDLSIPERGQLLDDVLQLNVWQKASELATKKCSTLEKEVIDKKKDLAYIEGQLSQLQSEEVVKKQVKDWDVEQKSEIKLVKKKLEEWEEVKKSDLADLEKKLEVWKDSKQEEVATKIQELSNIESELELVKAQEKELNVIDSLDRYEKDVKNIEHKLISTRKEYTQLETKLSLVVQPKDFWSKFNNCPTCFQSITKEQKCEHIQLIEQQEQELSNKLNLVNTTVEQLKVDLEKAKKICSFIQAQKAQQEEQKRNSQRDIKRLESQLALAEQSASCLIQEIEQNLNPFSSEMAKLEKEQNPYTHQLESLQSKRNPFENLLSEIISKNKELEEKKTEESNKITKVEQTLISTEYWKHGFKRIRLFFINQILSALQIEIQSAMSALGLDKWSINLCTESVTKSETTKLGVQIQVRQPLVQEVIDKLDGKQTSPVELSSFSGGESQRLRLAVAMGLGSLIQRSSGSWWNLEIFDEPGAHLSEQGMEDLLEALAYRAESSDKSIFITHHSALTHGSFSEIWEVKKGSNGSKVSRSII